MILPRVSMKTAPPNCGEIPIDPYHPIRQDESMNDLQSSRVLATSDGTRGLSRRAPRERRKLILDTADVLFRTRGYDATTLADVARAAGVAVGTVYLSFADKPSLMLGVITERKARLAAIIDEAVETFRPNPPRDLADAIRRIVAPLFDQLAQTGSLQPVGSLAALEGLGPEAVAAFSSVDRAIGRAFDATRAQGLSREMPMPSGALVASGMMQGMVEAHGRGFVDRHRAIDELCDAFARWMA
jgi:AcrR family transcriptional regulator